MPYQRYFPAASISARSAECRTEATPGSFARAPAPRRVEPAAVDAIEAIFALPFSDLLLRAQHVHREHHAPNAVQLSTLLSIKTGGCPEDCAYCPQAAR